MPIHKLLLAIEARHGSGLARNKHLEDAVFDKQSAGGSRIRTLGPAVGTHRLGTAPCCLRDPSPLPFRRKRNRLSRLRDRGFGSCFLHRRVRYEPIDHALKRDLGAPTAEPARPGLLPNRLDVVGQVAPRHDQPRARAAVRHRRGRRDETIISFRTKDDPIVVPAGRSGVGKMLVAGAVEVDAGKPRRPAEGDRGLWQGPDPRFCPRRSGPTDLGGDGRLAAYHSIPGLRHRRPRPANFAASASRPRRSPARCAARRSWRHLIGVFEPPHSDLPRIAT